MAKTLTTAQKKDLNRLAINTPNLKDYGSSKMTNGEPTDGYFQLKDGRVIKIKDLYPTQQKETEQLNSLIKIAEANPQLRNLKGIGLDKDGNPKDGFIILPQGKVVFIKHILALEN